MEEDSGHEGLSHKRRTKQIRYYFNLGLQHQEILCFLEKYHNISISLRTLKRDLRWMNLYRRNSYSNVEVVANLIEQQVRKSGQLHGYKWMHLKCIQAGLRVKQTTVSSLLQILDPLGVDMRKRRRLRRRVYSNQGPNYLWHVDGYDKLKPYGICISGCVDGFSRHIMWLNAASTNKNPEVIAGFYIKTLQMLGGFPRTIRCDMGTENGHLENMQIFFRRGNEIDHDTMPPFLYGTSQANQRIESWWCILRKHNAQFWMNLFEQLKDDGLFTGSFIDKSLIQYCFLHIIQAELDEVVQEWNTHRIRRVRQSVSPNGRPIMLYNFPEKYDAINYSIPVSREDISACLDECLFLEKPCDEDVYNFCEIIREELNYHNVVFDPFDAVDLYINLRREILSLL